MGQLDYFPCQTLKCFILVSFFISTVALHPVGLVLLLAEASRFSLEKFLGIATKTSW